MEKLNSDSSDALVDIIFSKRVALESDNKDEVQSLKKIIAEKVNYFTSNDMPIEFSMSAFSLKSQVPGKCASNVADMAEYNALLSFSDMINNIKSIYNKGANINFFADGRIFVGVIYGFTDELVTNYLNSLKNMVGGISENIKFFSLEDFYGDNFDNARKNLFSQYQFNSIQTLEELAETEYGKNLITFTRDFYAKDIRRVLGLSIKQSKVIGLKIASGVFTTSRSWGKVIGENTNPNCIKFSCHPRPFSYEPGKIGVYMTNANIKCCMPWHGVALSTNQGMIYKRLENVIEIGAELVNDDIFPYYKL